MNPTQQALDALKAAYITMQHMGNAAFLNNMDAVDEDEDAEHDAAFEAVRAAIAALEAEPQDTTVLVRLHRPEGYEDVHPELVMEDAHIHPDFRPELANGLGRAEPQGWRPISEAPKDGLFQDGNNHYAEYILAWHPAASLPYRARWWFRDDTGACNFLADGGYAVFPTVFQPLPTPPKD